MVLREDGTKWACHSCLKGHRVSGCNHTDRELVLVPKKGRPVTQCGHCRIERKKRSAHVKCDCGEVEKPHHPKEKCIHLREAEERVKQGLPAENPQEKDKEHLASVAEEQGCCCHHGGKCSCAIKKEDGHDDHDGSLPHGVPAVSKPRLDTTKSDGHITIFANGHHKPVHRKNHAAHETCMPYKLPMPRAHTTENMTTRRSVDDMGIKQNSTFNTNDGNASISIPFDTGRRKSKSEQTSPTLPPLDTNGAWPSGAVPNGLPVTDMDFMSSLQSSNDFASAFGCPSFSYTADNSFGPASGAAESQYDPWSALASGDCSGLSNTNPFDNWPTSQDAANLLVQPALTAASSGTHSEIDETPPIDESYGTWHMPSIQEDSGPFNMSDPYLASLQSSGNNSNRHSLPASFFGNANLGFLASTPDPPTSTTSYAPFDSSKASAYDNSMPSLDDSWTMPDFPLATQMPHRLRQQHNMPKSHQSQSSRPSARSVGPSSAPNDELMRELFPELEEDNDTGNGQSYSSDAVPTISSQGNATNFGYGSGDEGSGFASQPWTDGSMSIPYDLDQNYSSQGSGNGNWSQ